jgi:hypothetical protein
MRLIASTSSTCGETDLQLKALFPSRLLPSSSILNLPNSAPGLYRCACCAYPASLAVLPAHPYADVRDRCGTARSTERPSACLPREPNNDMLNVVYQTGSPACPRKKPRIASHTSSSSVSAYAPTGNPASDRRANVSPISVSKPSLLGGEVSTYPM